MIQRKEKKDTYIRVRVRTTFKNEFLEFCDKNEYTPSHIVRDLVKKYMDGKVKFLK